MTSAGPFSVLADRLVQIGPGSGIGALTAGETYIGYMGVTEDPGATSPDDRYEAVAVVEVR